MRVVNLMLRVTVSLLVAFPFTQLLDAQSCTQTCGQVLTGGVFATSIFKQSANKALVFQSWACQHSFQEVQKALSGGLDVHILGPLYGGSGQFSQSDFEMNKQSNCSTIDIQMSSESSNDQITKVGDATIVNGFNQCMSTCSDGLTAYADTSGLNPIVHVTYRQALGGPSLLKFTPAFSLPDGVVATGRTGSDAHVLFADGTSISPGGDRSVALDRSGYSGEFSVTVTAVDSAGNSYRDATVRIPERDADLHKMQNLAMVPIGSIVAYIGPVDTAHPLPESWMLCDGSPLSSSTYPALFVAIGTANGDGRDIAGIKVADFNLPDLRGEFLRGTDLGRGVDPDRNARTSAKLGGDSGDSVASVERQATARPITPFTTDTQGTHHHDLNLEITAGRQDGSVHNTAAWRTLAGGSQGTTSDAGSHSHTITGGGDAETRPSNVNVNWIIRVK